MDETGGLAALGRLSNEDLLARLCEDVSRGHAWQARLIAHLGEVDHRKLYVEHACPSMWDFCVRKLRMSESEAQRRIAVARAVRQFPRVLAYLERGDVHLCALYALRKHLTGDNHDELLREAVGKSTSDVELLIATRFPRSDVAQRVEPVAPQPSLSLTEVTGGGDGSGGSVARPSGPEAHPRIEPLSSRRYRVELTVSADLKAKLDRTRDLMRHRNPTGDLETILDISLGLLLAKLERERLGTTPRSKQVRPSPAKEGDRGSPDGGAATKCGGGTSDGGAGTKSGGGSSDGGARTTSEAVEAPVRALMNAVSSDARMNAASWGHARLATNADVPSSATVPTKSDSETTRDQPRRETRTRSGTIPRATRRDVFARDGERCTYVGGDGDRCPARGYLELDHVHPKALGGVDTTENLRVRCRAHNQMYAEQIFGRSHVERRIHLRQRKCVNLASFERSSSSSSSSSFERSSSSSSFERSSSLLSPFERASSALRSMGFRAPEVRTAIMALRSTRDEPPLLMDPPVETIVREALALLT
ncbi:MAG: HNH endonuclease [Labilithrix sp.]|nr:HNH endonuclease [Labilithrix sp.]